MLMLAVVSSMNSCVYLNTCNQSQEVKSAKHKAAWRKQLKDELDLKTQLTFYAKE